MTTNDCCERCQLTPEALKTGKMPRCLAWDCPCHTVTVEEKIHHKYVKSISMPGEQCAVCGFQKDNLRHFIATPTSNGIEENAWEGQIVSLVGEASMCWNPIPTGVFDSEEAMLVAYKIVKIARAVADKARQEGKMGMYPIAKEDTQATFKAGFEAALGEVSAEIEKMEQYRILNLPDPLIRKLDLQSFLTNLKKKQ